MIQLIASLVLASYGADVQQPFGTSPRPGGRQGGRRPGFPGAAGQAPGGAPGATPAARTGPLLEMIPWVRTKHAITVHGVKIDYTATCGWLPIRDANAAVTANMFFVEYTKDGADLKKRPVTFAFNGGPGSSSMWLHMGAIGPRRVRMNDDGSMPQPPFEVVDNTETWLNSTDIVMLDAVGTGYSRTTDPANRSFYGLQGDLQGFTAAIKEYLTREHRWGSPKFVAGESYGGMRVAGLSYSLLRAGIALNGIVSISGVMNDATLDGGRFNDLPYFSFLPSEAAVAWYHKRLAPKYQAMTVEALCGEVEKFTTGEYAAALNAGDAVSPQTRADVIAKLSAYTGIPKSYYQVGNMRIRGFSFMAELLRDKNESVGRYDGRLIGHVVDSTTGRPDFDASDAATSPVFIAGFNEYIDSELKFHPRELRTNLEYRGTAYQFIGGWDYGGRSGYPDTSQDLQRCMDQNPYMKVMLCCGRFDLACPYMGMRYVMAHLGEDPALKKNIHFEYFLAGHMMYIEKSSREKLQRNIGDFIASAVPS
ncbi:MAG: S10 family peptidase [Fimbriimonadaceae bacterium]